MEKNQMNSFPKYFENLSNATLNSLKSCFDHTECMLTFDEGVLLYCLAKEVVSGCIVEIGSYRGGSTVFLGRGSIDGAQVPVYAIDPHKNFIGVLGGLFGPKDRTVFYRTMLEQGCSEIVSLINLSSEHFASKWEEPVSLLWIDGDHRYEGVKRDFELWMPHLATGAIIVFDDAIDPNLGPCKLINEITISNHFEEIMTVGKVVVIRVSNSK
jgi:predicted O-methyltransferase YrrM